MPVGQGGMGCFLRFEKVEVRYQMPKRFGFRGALVVSLLCEVRLHLSIAFESKLSSLCIRFALTLPLQGATGSKPPSLCAQSHIPLCS